MQFCKPRVGDVVHFITSTNVNAPHVAALIVAVDDVDDLATGSYVCRLKIFGDERDTVAYGRIHGDTAGTWHYREECDQ